VTKTVTKILILSFILLPTINPYANETDSLGQKRSSSSKIAHSPSDSEYSDFIKQLKERTDYTNSWISRKEIAAWSAAVLFLSILMVLFNSKKIANLNKFLISLFIILLFLFFIGFIHQQFGALTSKMAYQQVSDKWIINSFQNKTLPDSLRNMSVKDLDSLFQKDITSKQDTIRKFSIYTKAFAPLNHFIYRVLNSGEKVHTTENEEGILYDILLLTTLSFIIFIISSDDKRITNSHRKQVTRKRISNPNFLGSIRKKRHGKKKPK
jgi:hypothetical protein